MGKYNFDLIVDRRNTDSIKYNDKRDNSLPMWVADMDFKVLPEITEALINKIKDYPAYGYVDVNEEYFKAYQSWFKRHHDVDINIDYFVFATGVVAAIDSIFKHILKNTGKVMMQTPIYHTFFHCIDNNQITLVENQLIYENGKYQIDWKNLENNIKNGGIAAFLLCNPHNPTGISFSKNELNRIAKLCHENGVLLLSDEVHGDIASPGYKYTPILSVDEEYQDIVVSLFSPSKAFNVASINAAAVVVPNQELRNKIQEGLWQDDVGEPNFFACAGAIAAYNHGDLWNQEMNEYIERNKQYVYKFFQDNLKDINVVETHFSYLMWIDVSHFTNNSKEFANELKEKNGIWVSNGHDFHGNGDYFIRLNVATSLNNVKDFCNRFFQFIEYIKQ